MGSISVRFDLGVVRKSLRRALRLYETFPKEAVNNPVMRVTQDAATFVRYSVLPCRLDQWQPARVEGAWFACSDTTPTRMHFSKYASWSLNRVVDEDSNADVTETADGCTLGVLDRDWHSDSYSNGEVS